MALKTILKHVLIDKDMQAKDLAALIGANQAQVSQWVNGRVAPELERAIQIAEVLGIPVQDLWKRV